MTVSDVDEAPATFLWGKLKRTIPKFGDLSIKGGMDATAREYVGLDMSANAFGTSVQVLGSAGKLAMPLRKDHRRNMNPKKCFEWKCFTLSECWHLVNFGS